MSNSCWVTPVSFENWSKLRSGLRWSVASEARTRKVKSGDTIIVYISGTNALCGAYKLNGDWAKTTELYWPDEIKSQTLKYPFQIGIQRTQEGVARIESLLDKLTFIGNKKKWSAYFHSVPGNFGRPIPNGDLQTVVNVMRANPLPTNLDSLIVRKGYTKQTHEEERRVGGGPTPVLTHLPLGSVNSLLKHVLDIDRLSQADKSIGPSVEYRFEDTVYGIFRMMQLPVTQLGYKSSGKEVEDGMIEAGDYLVLYDCKASREKIRLNAGLRREVGSYIRRHRPEVLNRRFVQLTFLIIGSAFDISDVEDAEDLSLELRKDVRVGVKVVLLTARALVRILEHWIADKADLNAKYEIFGLVNGLIEPRDVDALWVRLG